MVTTPLDDVALRIACRSTEFAVTKTEVAAVTFLASETVELVDETDTAPELEVRLAEEPEVVVMSPDPERTTSPDA